MFLRNLANDLPYYIASHPIRSQSNIRSPEVLKSRTKFIGVFMKHLHETSKLITTYTATTLRIMARYVLCRQPYGRKVPCKYVKISHLCQNTENTLRIESSKFVIMTQMSASLTDHDTLSFSLQICYHTQFQDLTQHGGSVTATSDVHRIAMLMFSMTRR
jgi:hypothetical protein